MRSRYMIGFVAAFVLFVLFLSAGYQITYDRVMDRQALKQEEISDAQSIAAEGDAVNDTEEGEGYYLCELQGFVVVYLEDRKTIYEFTEIPLTDLPEEVQQEVAEGKYMKDHGDLYAFLENYSS